MRSIPPATNTSGRRNRKIFLINEFL